ncbi:MAG TPA: peptidylprolyl isomerase [Chloroflexia bacterium]|nr:peptidylprolyl isomerase [Chloroflexia bacterium]
MEKDLQTGGLESLPRVEIQTELGNIIVELEATKAPHTTANFLRYVKAGHYRNTNFYRTVTPDNQPNDSVKIEVIQGGMGIDTLLEAKSPFPPIPIERTSETGLKHLDGTFSVSRLAADTGCSEFFICLGDQPELDFGGKRNPDGQGFAAFGQVVSGMEVVKAIQEAPHQAQNLTPPVKIINIVPV